MCHRVAGAMKTQTASKAVVNRSYSCSNSEKKARRKESKLGGREEKKLWNARIDELWNTRTTESEKKVSLAYWRRIRRWAREKKGSLHSVLVDLRQVLGSDSGWTRFQWPYDDAALKEAYQKAALLLHPYELRERTAGIEEKFAAERIFPLLQEAWFEAAAERRMALGL